jgi:hypothetical protein
MYVQAIAGLPNGDIAAAGSFTTAGGVAAKRVARWNGVAWSTLGSGMDNTVYALAVLPNGDLVAAGSFLSAGGVSVSRIARWDGSAWASLGSGVNGTVYALIVLPNGDVIAGGDFTSAGGVSAIHVARWDGSAWSGLGAGVGVVGSGNVRALAVLPGGDVLAGGYFTSAGGVAVGSIARWNGAAWFGLGQGVKDTVTAIHVLPCGDVAVGGTFNMAGDFGAGRWARWSPTGVPSVVQHPHEWNGSAGSAVTLSAVCSSGYDFDGPVNFQWKRNGANVSDGPGGASPGGGTVSGAVGTLTASSTLTTLAITGAQWSDTGSYSVTFTNACGTIESVAAAVSFGCPADLDGSGVVDGADLGLLLNAWGAGTTDITGDGFVDGADLGRLLSSWGPCPG